MALAVLIFSEGFDIGQLKTPEFRYLNYWILVWDYVNMYLFFFRDLMVFVAVVLLLLLFKITVSFRFRFGRRTRTRRAFKGWKGTGTHLILIYKKKMKISERKFPLAGLLFPLVVISHGTFKSLDKSWNFSRLESLTSTHSLQTDRINQTAMHGAVVVVTMRCTLWVFG